MTCTDDDPNANEGYAEFLDECAKLCRCCSCCQMRPCAGTMAGGLCDSMACRHDERFDDDGYNEDEDEE